jgi:GntR family transcriptional regulator
MKKHGIVLTNVKEYLEAIKPNKEIQNKLNIGQDTPVLKRVKNAKNKKGNFIEYTECYYVGDSYRYYIDLTNRY